MSATNLQLCSPQKKTFLQKMSLARLGQKLHVAVVALVLSAQVGVVPSSRAGESFMSRDTIIDMALDHIYEFESRSGKIKRREGIGGTVGGFHLRYKDNKDLAAAEGFTPQPGQSVEQQFNDFILADADRERRIARRRIERDYDMFVKDGVEAESLQIGEMVAGLNIRSDGVHVTQ